jgi:phage shock protein PspC (stress-responsive transcriptional regulator)
MITPETNIIKEGVHCPFCKTKEALLMSRSTFKKFSFQTPAFGLKFVLTLVFLPILSILLYGFKLFDFTKGIVYDTYGFCPNCGNSYPASSSETVKKEAAEPKFYRNKPRGKIMGLCAGVADYTGLSTGWVRFISAVYMLAPFAMGIQGVIGLVRAEAEFGDIFSAFIGVCVPSIVIAVVYLVIAAFIPAKISGGVAHGQQ